MATDFLEAADRLFVVSLCQDDASISRLLEIHFAARPDPPSRSRTAFGIVTCPFAVTVVIIVATL